MSCAAIASQAAVINTFSGTINSGSPTFHRPSENGDSAPVELSPIGTIFRYSTQAFTVPSTGQYVISSVQEGFDGYLVLYSGSFDPNNPLTNALIADDDANAGCTSDPEVVSDGTSGFSCLPGNPPGTTMLLNSGTSYILVTTTFNPEDTFTIFVDEQGSFTNTISDAAVPEPASMALAAAGLAALVLRRRFR